MSLGFATIEVFTHKVSKTNHSQNINAYWFFQLGRQIIYWLNIFSKVNPSERFSQCPLGLGEMGAVVVVENESHSLAMRGVNKTELHFFSIRKYILIRSQNRLQICGRNRASQAIHGLHTCGYSLLTLNALTWDNLIESSSNVAIFLP